jgi:hypothetical protein
MPCTRLYPDARPVRLPAMHRLAVRMQLPVLISREENLREVSTRPRGAMSGPLAGKDSGAAGGRARWACLPSNGMKTSASYKLADSEPN